jgi:hypothetical protein
MKTRHGFVSNSSSSSFVVAFPYKPESFEHVYEMMFGSENGQICPFDWLGEITHKAAAERVWADLGAGKHITTSFDTLVDLFSGRYCYHEGWAYQELGGGYFGIDKKTLAKFEAFMIQGNEETNNIHKAQQIIVNNEFLSVNTRPPYAYKNGTNPSTKKPYKKEEIETFAVWQKALEKFKKTHVVYQNLETKRMAGLSRRWREEEKFRKKLGEVDVKAFIEGQVPDAFIFTFEYSDNGGETALEHGDIFRNIPHVCISNH